MRRLFLPTLNFILFSNLFMSLCAVAQALVTLQLIHVKPYYPLLALLFASTLCVYNFSFFISKPEFPQKSTSVHIRWFFLHERQMGIITLLSVIAFVPLYFMLSFKSKLVLAMLSILSFGYSMPLFKKNGQKIGLRNITGLKSLLITLVWTASIVLLPVFEAEHRGMVKISDYDTIILFAKRFLFIGALTIPFDIRDVFHDNTVGLKTIPVIFGEIGAYRFCLFLLAGYLILLFIFRNQGFNNDFWALTLTVILAGWLIFKSGLKKNEYYYFLYMDGVLILQYLLLMLFNRL